MCSSTAVGESAGAARDATQRSGSPAEATSNLWSGRCCTAAGGLWWPAAERARAQPKANRVISAWSRGLGLRGWSCSGTVGGWPPAAVQQQLYVAAPAPSPFTLAASRASRLQ